MKLSPAQRRALERLRDGETLHYIAAGFTRATHRFTSQPAGERIDRRTVFALRDIGFIEKYDTKAFHGGCKYSITPAGREALGDG